MASSSSATLPQPIHYNVFLSFRGEDIRNDFRSHLYDALCRNQIFTFIDDNLKRGDNISSLFTAIEESIISVIIFSENYADSKWCLKELAKILQCRKLNGQIVIPVFYGVDPSHIRKQTGKFGLAFDKLKERLLEGEMDLDLDEVRSHLKEAADISGWNSQIISPESKLIKSIVGDILNILNRKTLNLPSSLVGIGSHVVRVETLLCLESPQFRIVGLWGMGGIGKTTIARAVFKHICSRFDAFHFVENVSNELRNQSVGDLWEKIVLKLFEEESLNMGSRTLHHDFIMNQLQRKKVLIVLDDVDDAKETNELLVGVNDHLFSEGSRILLTSRDKQVLKNIGRDHNQIYEVEGLSKEDGVQLFSLGAFKQNHPTSDRLALCERVYNYSRGNPLALVVLGCALFDKSKEEWVSALDGLGDEPFPDIQKVLRISYDALCDEEKTIFLDIASFLVGKTLDFVVSYYEGFVKRIEYKISNLCDKSLITICEEKKLGMHDLLKEMGRFIELNKRLEERIRIWSLKDLINVSKKMKACGYQGSSMIEAISVNLCQGEKISEFDCSVLARLDCLKFLEFHDASQSKVRFCWERFGGFPEELRYFRWDAYPHKSLGSNFCAENLVELHMPNNDITKLWTVKQNIVNLKVINFEGAKNMVEFPDVSEGRNIERINLAGCERLVRLPPSVQHLPKLEFLNLKFCLSVESAPTTFDSKVLKILDLSYCRGVKMFPQVASQGNIIRELILDGTDIREVPSSVELLKGLKSLSMLGCKKLSIISTNICKLKSLSKLNLFDCTNLESLPEIMEPMESLTRLDLSGCTRLKRLPNDDHSFHNLKSLKDLYLNDTAITELPSSIQHLICLQKLHISGCQNLTSLPSFIHNKRMLELDLKGCSNLCSLLELPSSLETLDANGCVSLKTISSACFVSESKTRILKFANCFNWDEEERRILLNNAFFILLYYLDEKMLKERTIGLDIASPNFECLMQKINEEITIGMDIASSNFEKILAELDITCSIEEESRRKLDMSKVILEKPNIGLDIISSYIEKLMAELDIICLKMKENRKKMDIILPILSKLATPDKDQFIQLGTPQEREIIQLIELGTPQEREIIQLILGSFVEFSINSMKERKKKFDITMSHVSEKIQAFSKFESYFSKVIQEKIQEERTIGLDNASSNFEVIQEERRIGLDIASSNFEEIREQCTIGLDMASTNFESWLQMNYPNFEIILPWSEIPKWFYWGIQSVGSSLTVELPMDVQCYRFVFCVVIKPYYSNSVGRNHMYCHVDDNDAWVTSREFNLQPSYIEHLLLWYDGNIKLKEYSGREVSFQFRDKKGNAEVTKCGVLGLNRRVIQQLRSVEY